MKCQTLSYNMNFHPKISALIDLIESFNEVSVEKPKCLKCKIKKDPQRKWTNTGVFILKYFFVHRLSMARAINSLKEN